MALTRNLLIRIGFLLALCIVITLCVFIITYRGGEKPPEQAEEIINEPEIEHTKEDTEEDEEVPPAVSRESLPEENSGVRVSYQVQRSLSALSGLGGRVNVHEINPVNYENPNLDILRQMGVDQYIISFFTGEQFYKAGDYDKALAEYTASINRNADFIEALISRGNTLLRRGEYRRAIDDYTRSIRLDANRAELYNYRGYARSELAANNNLGELKLAIEDFSRAIALNSSYTDALINRSQALYAIGEYDRVIEDCGRIISLEPRNASAWNRRGNAWYNKGELNNALADYNQALAINPSLANAYTSREIVLHLLPR